MSIERNCRREHGNAFEPQQHATPPAAGRGGSGLKFDPRD